MQITDKLLRPLTEVKYLNADNVDRYRCIMRIFFENYGRKLPGRSRIPGEYNSVRCYAAVLQPHQGEDHIR